MNMATRKRESFQGGVGVEPTASLSDLLRVGEGGSANLREFVLNSRHPGPRRVWKVGSVARWLPPLPLARVDPVQCAKRWFRLRDTILFPPRRHSKLSLAKAWPEAAQWAPKGPQRAPKGSPVANSGLPVGLFQTISDYFGLAFPQHVKIPGKNKCPKKRQTKLKSGTAMAVP